MPIWPLLPRIMTWPSRVVTLLIRDMTTRPGCRALMLERSISREAVPPMWKVRMVNCVPGSPMDWAAIMPTVSPMFTKVPAREVAAVTAGAHAAFRLAGEGGADADAGDALFLKQTGDIFINHGGQTRRAAPGFPGHRWGKGSHGQGRCPERRILISPPSTMWPISMPSTVPQSSSDTVTSCTTSTRRRVR